MKQIGALFRQSPLPQKAKPTTERGELLETFRSNIAPTWDSKRFGPLTLGRLAKKLEGIPTKDLYYLDRVCSDSKHYAKRFFWELNPKKHELKS